MKCSVKRTGEILAERVEVAATFWARLKGLMFRGSLPQGNALLLDPCPQIHTCFMRFSIDAVFLDKKDCVVAVIENLKPWRMSSFYIASHRTLELPNATLRGRVKVGDQLTFN